MPVSQFHQQISPSKPDSSYIPPFLVFFFLFFISQRKILEPSKCDFDGHICHWAQMKQHASITIPSTDQSIKARFFIHPSFSGFFLSFFYKSAEDSRTFKV